MDFAALSAELLAGHPVTGPYDADEQIAADQMNTLNRSRIRASMTGAEIWAATSAAEYALLSEANKNQWLGFCAIVTHDPAAGGLAQLFVVEMFGGGSVTVSTLGRLRNEDISRATELDLGRVRAAEIIEARTL